MNKTHDNLEQEVTVHQTQFNARSLRDTFKPREEPKNDREQHHEDGQERGGQDTRDDSDNDGGQVADPCEPVVCTTERVNVADRTNESHYTPSYAISDKILSRIPKKAKPYQGMPRERSIRPWRPKKWPS